MKLLSILLILVFDIIPILLAYRFIRNYIIAKKRLNIETSEAKIIKSKVYSDYDGDETHDYQYTFVANDNKSYKSRNINVYGDYSFSKKYYPSEVIKEFQLFEHVLVNYYSKNPKICWIKEELTKIEISGFSISLILSLGLTYLIFYIIIL